MVPLTRRARPLRAARLLGRAVRGLVAAAMLLALVGGLPWALVRFVGWPLPDHLPTLDEIGAVLMAPMSTSFLLDGVACLAWLLWFVFALEVAACALDVASGARALELRLRTGPLRRVAAVLVGTLLVAVLGRAASAAPVTSVDPARPAGHAPVVATAPAWTATQPESHTALSCPPGTERVREAANGVHDSLWRVAQRCLGDGDRWPEIWALNQGSTQPSGRLLTNPNRIHPGDVLRLPAQVTPVPPSATGEDTPPPAPQTPTPTGTPAPAPARPADPPAEDIGGGGVTWGGEIFVSLGLAGAVSALLVLARRRRHARYRPGSGRRADDLPIPPAVYQLRLAHLRAQHGDEDEALQAETADTESPAGPRSEDQMQVLAARVRHVVPALRWDSGLDTAVREVDGNEIEQIALDLAAVHGLGLVGPGGYAAARALVLAALTTTDGPVTVLVPADDLTRLLGLPVAGPLPDRITVVADLDAALTVLDSHPTHQESRQPGLRTILVASPPREPEPQTRLQQLLDNGAPSGISAVLLGQWRAGVTAYVTSDGIISATDPGHGEPLRGARAFTLPDTATRDLLAFLHTTQSPQPSQPHDESSAEEAAPADRTQRLEIVTGPPPAESDDDHPAPPTTEDRSPGVHTPLTLAIFGGPTLHWRPDPNRPGDLSDVTGHLTSRLLELLVFLAVHPRGVSRDAIVDALWPDHPPRNPASVLRTVLSRIRRALDTATRGTIPDLVLGEHGHYRLNPALVHVDYWAFTDAVSRRRTAPTPDQRIEAYEAIVACYGGTLADGLDAEWLTAAREATRRDALDAVAALARAHVDTDPDYTLDLLETARAFDPHNELLYRDIMRLQHVLGKHDAISRTLTLLHTRLTEIDATPTPDTIDLAQRLRAYHTGIPTEKTRPSPEP
ncbi:hypothetical protein GCM10022380_81110 [Amycolatopsis tucumanensis]|uniref:Transcriptional regulator n=1 Tax=Amycolatopsis tucumanensis TaxID=401106 RepID=A0ABP7JPW0_9PSEU